MGISRCLICLRIIFCHGCRLSLTLDSSLKDATSRPAFAVGNSVSGAVTQCSAWMLSHPKRYVNSSLPDAAELPGLDWHSNSFKVISFIDNCGISLLLLKDKRIIGRRSLCFVWLEEAEFWTIQYIDCYHIQPFPLRIHFLAFRPHTSQHCFRNSQRLKRRKMGDGAAARFPLNLPAFSSLARLGLADSGSLYGTASQLVLFYNKPKCWS